MAYAEAWLPSLSVSLAFRQDWLTLGERAFCLAVSYAALLGRRRAEDDGFQGEAGPALGWTREDEERELRLLTGAFSRKAIVCNLNLEGCAWDLVLYVPSVPFHLCSLQS